MKRLLPWDEAEEVAFECEPGTLTEGKLQVIKDLGVTRLSLGIENFDDEILKINGRAHTSKEIEPAYRFARSIGFPQINIDLIAGMVGETTENWRECVRKTIELDPDSVTIYQMEVPYNTTIFKEMKVHGADRRAGGHLEDQARLGGLRLLRIGEGRLHRAQRLYGGEGSSTTRFVYTDLLWTGADMIGLGVASFSHVQGTHFQNEHEFETYSRQTAARAPADLPRLHADPGRAHDSRVDPANEARARSRIILSATSSACGFRSALPRPLAKLRDQGFLVTDADSLRLNRDGLLQVDRLLYEFFLPEHRRRAPPEDRRPMQNCGTYDAIVIGGGPAGSKWRCAAGTGRRCRGRRSSGGDVSRDPASAALYCAQVCGGVEAHAKLVYVHATTQAIQLPRVHPRVSRIRRCDMTDRLIGDLFRDFRAAIRRGSRIRGRA